MVLPEGRFALATDDRSGDADRRQCAGQVDVAAADGEHLADARRGSEHNLDDRAELAVGFRSGDMTLAGFPSANDGADGVDLEGSSGRWACWAAGGSTRSPSGSAG